MVGLTAFGCTDKVATQSKTVNPGDFAGRPDKMPKAQRDAMAAGMKSADEARAKAQANANTAPAPRAN